MSGTIEQRPGGLGVSRAVSCSDGSSTRFARAVQSSRTLRQEHVAPRSAEAAGLVGAVGVLIWVSIVETRQQCHLARVRTRAARGSASALCGVVSAPFEETRRGRTIRRARFARSGCGERAGEKTRHPGLSRYVTRWAGAGLESLREGTFQGASVAAGQLAGAAGGSMSVGHHRPTSVSFEDGIAARVGTR
jgi:hypothetical protein